MSILSCQFRLKLSHHLNQRSLHYDRQHVLADSVEIKDASCLGLSLERLSIRPLETGGCHLKAVVHDVDEAKIETFLYRFEVALTSHFGLAEREPHYGTVYVEFDRVNLRWQAEPRETERELKSEALTVKVGIDWVKVENRSTFRHSISESQLNALRYNHLLQLYADGLRAGTAESKFFHWFIIFEEFLEKSSHLNDSFNLLFNEAEQVEVCRLADRLGGTKKGALRGVLRATEDSRAEKLSKILNNLGIKHIPIHNGNISVDVNLCKSFIEQRNRLFHQGAHIKDGLLYNCLFPIVTELARQSDKLVRLRGQN